MAQLAFKGSNTEGDKIIRILNTLGGKNKLHCTGKFENRIYFINKNGIIESIEYDMRTPDEHFVMEIKGFVKMYPYEFGDTVIANGVECLISDIKWLSDEEIIIYEIFHKYNSPLNGWCYSCELRPLPKKETDKEETMGNKPNLLQHLKEYFENTPQEVIETEWHEYAKYNEIGPSVEDYLEYVNNIRQPKYPKTFVDCCEILYPNENFQTVSQPIKGHNGKKLFALRKLLICRDAYWKITMDWEPNWEDETDIYYTISYDGANIKCYNNTDVYSKLAFPTEEMRDIFYENFKKLIEQCKEFL